MEAEAVARKKSGRRVLRFANPHPTTLPIPCPMPAFPTLPWYRYPSFTRKGEAFQIVVQVVSNEKKQMERLHLFFIGDSAVRWANT